MSTLGLKIGLLFEQLCAKFGWNWIRCSWEEVKNVQFFEKDRQTIGDQENSFKTFSSDEGNLKVEIT